MKLRRAIKLYWALWRGQPMRETTSTRAVARFRKHWRRNVRADVDPKLRRLLAFCDPNRPAGASLVYPYALPWDGVPR